MNFESNDNKNMSNNPKSWSFSDDFFSFLLENTDYPKNPVNLMKSLELFEQSQEIYM